MDSEKYRGVLSSIEIIFINFLRGLYQCLYISPQHNYEMASRPKAGPVIKFNGMMQKAITHDPVETPAPQQQTRQAEPVYVNQRAPEILPIPEPQGQSYQEPENMYDRVDREVEEQLIEQQQQRQAYQNPVSNQQNQQNPVSNRQSQQSQPRSIPVKPVQKESTIVPDLRRSAFLFKSSVKLQRN